MELPRHTYRTRYLGLAIALVVIAAVAFTPPRFTRWLEFHCPHRMVLGFGCPLCGSTRAITSIAHFRFADAFRLNPAIFVVILFGVFEIVNLITHGKYENRRVWLIYSILTSYLLVYLYRVFEFHIQK